MKKIAILALHLSYGGVEQSIINQANMLVKKYEVKLVSIYKIGKPSFYVDPKVKIVYLTNLKPNKEEFINSLKKFNLIFTIKEGFKSIKILYLKKKLMKDYIINSDDDILISSRIEITELVNTYAKNKIKICEEHRHHNNDYNYINRLKKATNNMDYLVNVSNELNSFYKKNLNVKCIYIPNSLDYFPLEISNLNNKKIISVGRLSHEKGFLDLVDVFKIMSESDSELELNIIGDGEEKDKIKEKIKELKLTDKVKLHGFKNKEYINDMYKNSSLYLMCSFEESFGIVLIEAGSFGLPLIAFNSARGASEIIKNNKSGYLIDNRDKEKMARKALDLLNDKVKMKSFSKEAREISKLYTFDNVSKQWLDFIKRFDK